MTPKKTPEQRAEEYATKDRIYDGIVGAEIDAFLAGHQAGRVDEREKILEALRSEEANKLFADSLDEENIFISNENWADWLEGKLKDAK